MKLLLLFPFVAILGFFSNAQVTCPLNTCDFPFQTCNSSDSYSWSAGLYSPSQLGGAQTMTSISFRLDNASSYGTNYTYTNIRIYLRHTSVNSYPNGSYPTTTGFTHVFTGDMTFNNVGVYTFTFNQTTSFAFNGTNNLEVLFENRDGTFNTKEPWFDRTDQAPAGIYPGKRGMGSSWSDATSFAGARWPYNLRINPLVTGCTPLNVSFTDSQLKCDGNNVHLSWNVASEKNNDYYTVESSTDGINWRAAQTVKGAGTVTKPINYEVILNKTSSELMYYRLSQTDFDGTKTMLVTHVAECNENEIKISPNPFSDFFTIYTDKKINQISLTNALGEEIAFDKTKYDNRMVVNTTDLKNGVYFLTVKTDQETKTHRLIKN